jgi:putative transposase
MPRPSRRLAAGSIHHVLNRAALRHALFDQDADRRLFVGALRDALGRHPVDLMAWRLMPNHWHLLLRPRDEAALPRFVRWLTLAHCCRWQAFHGRTGQGTIYRGRYRSSPVEADGYLLAVLRYIEHNPVRAGLVPSAADWAWSSARERAAGRGGLLAALPVELPGGWVAHLDAPQTPAEVAAVRGTRP